MNLLIYCAGGLGREVLDLAHRLNRAQNRWHQIAFLDDSRPEPTHSGAAVFTVESALARFPQTEIEAVIANGEPSVRKILAEKLAVAQIPLATLVDPTAVVSDFATIGPGTIIFPHCFVSSHATLGQNVALIVGAAIGHDTRIADHCVVSGQVNIGGDCTIGAETYIAMGAQIKQQTRIGHAAVIGMGSVVFSDIPDDVIALGNPCRPMRPNTNKKVFA